MKPLRHLLNEFGFEQLPLSHSEREFADNFVDFRSDFFLRICQQKQEKTQHALALGLFTQSIQQAQGEFKATQSKIAEMDALFEQHVGKQHAQKFHTMNEVEVTAIAKIWFLCQGCNGIDFSYANDHATEISQQLAANHAQQAEIIRQQFMQCYYIGVDHAHTIKPRTNWLLTLQKAVKSLFN
ncbi:hypothetical protein C9J03_08940 [Photobacterium gaetbulicola]|uniref:Uncharacterized protein n=1 Tax=Photobacterium gaetbulicola Gung47 TaxID=658445 RepID=A0A0C5WJT5_9GAMM|nr:hypothetical protein [Photobacterium gaetbulicola]AJR05364.1 hypothetical protein H744_1c0339 [Photobacterium gaetbulicola Gung47]PSU12688.1 hypothetical protein C9J03_08940 [Photobacterium gaetbulicola]